MAKPAIVIVKSFQYRDSPEEWSNKYFFAEAPPSSDTGWKTLIDAVIGLEKTVYTAGTKVVRAYGYSDGDDDAVYSYDYLAHSATVAGTYALTGSDTATPGDTASWVRWATSKRNTKGKTVYLRKYYHGGAQLLGDSDKPPPALVTALTSLGTALAGGTGHITGFTVCGADGTAAGLAAASTFLTTRTLKRRGKRPPT